MFGSVISSVWRLMRGTGGTNPFAPPLLQIARRLHQQKLQLSQQPQPGQLTQQQPLQPLQQDEQPTPQPVQPMQLEQMPSFVPYDQNQFLHSLLSGATRSMFRRPWQRPDQQMPGQPSMAQILMRLLGR